MLEIQTISEITAHIRQRIESDPLLQDTWVQGEVSNMRPAASGHWYFTLKDNGAQLKSVMWRSDAQRQSFVPQEGDQIVAHGRIGVYDQRGDYQFYADFIRSGGIGDLYSQFEQLKQRLQDEGLFDPEHKKPLPAFPLQIGVVTSENAAAFQDILNVLRRRFPLATVTLSHTLVQGIEAPPMIAEAIQRLDTSGLVDVILVIRGGGSIEDLWAFNDEAVARAIFAANTPIISGVGHETDFTIADFVADHRAPTPSSAAEVATPNITDIRMDLVAMQNMLTGMTEQHIDRLRQNLDVAQRQLDYQSPLPDVRNMRQRVDELNTRLHNLQQNWLVLLRERLSAKSAVLDAASPDAILKRGYAIVTRSDSQAVVRAPQDAPAGTQIEITTYGGKLTARTEEES